MTNRIVTLLKASIFAAVILVGAMLGNRPASARDGRLGWSAPECSRDGFQLSARQDGPRPGQAEDRGRGESEGKRRHAREIASVDAAGEAIERRIHVIRHERVMLDADLAGLYGVETGRLNEAVQRNLARFPKDFMFQLTADEARNLRSQNAISSSRGYGGRRYLPYAFTEQGVAMLSSVLSSRRAIAVNILIVRTFAQASSRRGPVRRTAPTHWRTGSKSPRTRRAPRRNPWRTRSARTTRADVFAADRIPAARTRRAHGVGRGAVTTPRLPREPGDWLVP